jgi:inorganic triphosphatase YgiF
MAVKEAFDVIAYSTLRHFSSSANGVRSLDSEAVHQMRVGLRRLRAAVSLFKSSLPGPSTAKIKTDLKWLANELAPAREIDVLVRERIRPLRHVADPPRGGSNDAVSANHSCLDHLSRRSSNNKGNNRGSRKIDCSDRVARFEQDLSMLKRDQSQMRLDSGKIGWRKRREQQISFGHRWALR